MKKIFLILSVGLVIGSAYALDLSRYQYVEELSSPSITQPAIEEVSGLLSGVVYVVTNASGTPVEQQFVTTRKVRVIAPRKVTACSASCEEAPALLDGSSATTYDFSLNDTGTQHGRIVIDYAKPLETDAVVFTPTQDSYLPNSFVLTIDGKRVLNTIYGSAAKFPKMSAQHVEIDFEYSQPLRLSEVGVGMVTEVEESSFIRFVYQPGEKYLLYSGENIRKEVVPSPPINLFAKNKEVAFVAHKGEKNPVFKQGDDDSMIDTDKDGIPDLADNCPLWPNRDQRDGNANGIGDVCDDYDYDGVSTYRDNCPYIANQEQKDTDRDGLGDACDQEESRFTERYAFVPWIVFGVVILAVFAMGYEVIKKKKLGE